jgi:hypothetical protein
VNAVLTAAEQRLVGPVQEAADAGEAALGPDFDYSLNAQEVHVNGDDVGLHDDEKVPYPGARWLLHRVAQRNEAALITGADSSQVGHKFGLDPAMYFYFIGGNRQRYPGRRRIITEPVLQRARRPLHAWIDDLFYEGPNHSEVDLLKRAFAAPSPGLRELIERLVEDGSLPSADELPRDAFELTMDEAGCRRHGKHGQDVINWDQDERYSEAERLARQAAAVTTLLVEAYREVSTETAEHLRWHATWFDHGFVEISPKLPRDKGWAANDFLNHAAARRAATGLPPVMAAVFVGDLPGDLKMFEAGQARVADPDDPLEHCVFLGVGTDPVVTKAATLVRPTVREALEVLDVIFRAA